MIYKIVITIWIAIGGVVPQQRSFDSETRFVTKAECLAQIEADAPLMPDKLRQVAEDFHGDLRHYTVECVPDETGQPS